MEKKIFLLSGQRRKLRVGWATAGGIRVEREEEEEKKWEKEEEEKEKKKKREQKTKEKEKKRRVLTPELWEREGEGRGGKSSFLNKLFLLFKD